MIDIHIHTTYSDGTKNVTEILKQAEELHLDYISITDHDKCSAYEELKNIDISKYYSGKIIKGIEIKCAYKGSTIEVFTDDDHVKEIFVTDIFKNSEGKILIQSSEGKIYSEEDINWNYSLTLGGCLIAWLLKNNYISNKDAYGEIEGAEAVTKSFPDFFEKLTSLGIEVEKIEDKS